MASLAPTSASKMPRTTVVTPTMTGAVCAVSVGAMV